MNIRKQQDLQDFWKYEHSFDTEDEHPHKTMLKREIRAQALKRLEDGARTVSDFEEVISQWDHLDDNRVKESSWSTDSV